MKNFKYIFILFFAFVQLSVYGQVYLPADHTVSNKSYGMAQAGPTDARTYFYDPNFFKYRAYQSTAEVLAYLTLPKYRTGQFDIVINTGGTLASGVITGGTNAVWYFKDGQADGDLVPKITEAELMRFGLEDNTAAANRAFAWTTFGITHTFDGLAGASGWTMTSSSTAAASNLHRVLDVQTSGVNANSAQRTTAIYAYNNHSGSSANNNAIIAEIDNTTSSVAQAIRAIGNTATAIFANSRTGAGLYALNVQQDSIGNGLNISMPTLTTNSSAFGLNVGSGNSLAYPARISSNYQKGDTVVSILQLTHTASTLSTVGLGARQEFMLSSTTGSTKIANALVSRWTTATNGAEVSAFDIKGKNSGTEQTVITFAGNGQITEPLYGAGTFTGTLAKLAGWTSAGVRIEVDPSTIGATWGGKFSSSSSVAGPVTLTTSPAVQYTGTGGHTLTLPILSGNTNQSIRIKNAGSGDVTIATAGGGDVIYTTSSVASVVLEPGESMELIAMNSTTWQAYFIPSTSGGGGDVVGPASSTDNALVRFDLATGKLIQNSNAILTDGGDLELVGAIKVGTSAVLDARTKSLFVDASTAANSFSLSEWKATGDNADLNFEALAIVKHAKAYNLTPGYAGTSQYYGTAGSWGTIVGNNSFTGNTIPYVPLPTSQPNSYIRFELGPIWPQSEKMRINNSGDIIFGTTTLRNYDAAQAGTSTVNDPVNTFDAADASPGRFFAWANEVGGTAAFMDKITGYINANNITTERVRTITTQKGRVVEANAMIDTLGNGYFDIANINELRLSQYGSSYYKLTQDGGSLMWTRTGSSTPDTLFDISALSRLKTGRDIEINGSHQAQLIMKSAGSNRFVIKADVNSITQVANGNTPILFSVNGALAATINSDVVNFFKNTTIGPQTTAIARFDVQNSVENITAYFDNTKTSGTKTAGIFTTVNAGTSNRGISLSVSGGTQNIGLRVDAPTAAADNWTMYALGTAQSYHEGSLILGGAGIVPAAKLHVFSTTEQLRLGFDASNYSSWTVNSSGQLTIAPTGNQLFLGSATAGKLSIGTATVVPSYAVLTINGTSQSATIQMKLGNVEKGLFGIANATNDLATGSASGDIVFRNVTAAKNILFATGTGGDLRMSIAESTGTVAVAQALTVGTTITGGGTFISGGAIQSSTTNTSSNFAVLSSTSFATTTLSELLPTGASQIKARIIERGTTNTALATNDSYIGHMIGEMGVTEGGAGTHFLISSAGIRAPSVTTGAAASTNTALLFLDVPGTTGTNNYGLYSLSKAGFDFTYTTGGTTGNQTIDKPTGSVNIAAGGTTVTVTNSTVTANSIVIPVLMTNDATARDGMAVVVSAGSFVITLDAATTAECKIGFVVLN